MVAVGFMGLTVLGAEPAPPAAEVSAALKQLTAEAQKILTQEKVHTLLDRSRVLKEYGVTYLPELIAPNGLEKKLTGCNLRQYVGMKMFDALYAAAFNKRQAVADSITSIEAALQTLDLRSHADFSGRMMATLRKATSGDETVDAKKLADQLSADALQELPAALSSPETAHFLLDAFHGFNTEGSCMLGTFYTNGSTNRLKEWQQASRTNPAVSAAILDLFAAAAKQDNALHLDCQTAKDLTTVKDSVALVQARIAGTLTEEQRVSRWTPVWKKRLEERAAILSGAK